MSKSKNCKNDQRFKITHFLIFFLLAVAGVMIGLGLKYFFLEDQANRIQDKVYEVEPLVSPITLNDKTENSKLPPKRSITKQQESNLDNHKPYPKSEEDNQTQDRRRNPRKPKQKKIEVTALIEEHKEGLFEGKSYKKKQVKQNNDIFLSGKDNLSPKATLKAQTKIKGRQIAIVVDDMGVNERYSRKFLTLSHNLTLSYLPYGKNIKKQTEEAKSFGHELLMHLPMEPLNNKINPGPNALLSGIGKKEFLKTLNWNLAQFDGFKGVNNHMGSNLTIDHELMSILLIELKSRGLFFLDSLTNKHSVGEKIAKKMGLPFLKRDIFIDHINQPTEIKKQLKALERASILRGIAIGICHPRKTTLRVLGPWLKTLKSRGFKIVPLSSILAKKNSK